MRPVMKAGIQAGIQTGIQAGIQAGIQTDIQADIQTAIHSGWHSCSCSALIPDLKKKFSCSLVSIVDIICTFRLKYGS